MKASIRHWNKANMPTPNIHSDANKDIQIEHFRSSPIHFAGKQRRGLVGEHLECLSLLEHVDTALASPASCP